jgi:hypothetical protein
MLDDRRQRHREGSGRSLTDAGPRVSRSTITRLLGSATPEHEVERPIG